MIFERWRKRRQAKKEIKMYYKGCSDTSKERDERDKHKEKIFKNELEKKDKTISKLKEIIHKNDDNNNDLKKDIIKLKEELILIEGFVETKQLKVNVDAIRKLATIQNAEKIVRAIDRKTPEIKKISEDAVVESKIIE